MEYNERYKKEIDNFKDNAEVHDLPKSFHYVANQFILPDLQTVGINSVSDLFYKIVKRVQEKKNDVHILSLGAGNCDIEILFAQNTDDCVFFTCVEINPEMITRAKNSIRETSIIADRFTFINEDVNSIQLSENAYDIVFVSQALHHFTNLEHIFEQLQSAMTDDGFFITNDTIGRNGHMMYESTEKLVDIIWKQLPYRFKWHNVWKRSFEKREQFDCSTECFEGIRAQDILPILNKNFTFDIFAAFNTLVPFFLDRDFGPNFNCEQKYDRALLKFLHDLDKKCYINKWLRPTAMIAVMRKRWCPVTDAKYLFGLSPKDILSIPDGIDESLLYKIGVIPSEIQMLDEDIPKDYRVGTIIKINKDSADLREYEMYGLNNPEAGMAWTTQSYKIVLKVKEEELSKEKISLCLSFISWQAISAVEVYVNKTELARIKKWNTNNSYSIDLPKAVLENCIRGNGKAQIHIELIAEGATTPKTYGIGEDVRVLGVALSELSLR